MDRIFLFSIALLFSATAHSESIIKDWAWNTSGKNFAYAGTINDHNRVFGQYCYYASGNCLYAVDLGITCTKGEDFPALVNSDKGAIALHLICGNAVHGDNILIIHPFKNIDNLVKTTNRIGIAIAMHNGKFKVVRFSMAGSKYAIESMRAAAWSKLNQFQEHKKPLSSEEFM